MINEISVIGSMETSYHTISLSTNGMDITISPGEYHKNGQIVWSDPDGGTVTIPNGASSYQLYLMQNNEITLYQFSGADNLSRFYNQNHDSIIDRIAWFDVPDGVTSLDNVEINVVKLVLQQ